MTRLLASGLLLAGALILLLLPLRRSPWIDVGSRQIDNISGLAFVPAPGGSGQPDGNTLVLVHDNKLPDEPRVGLVRRADGRYTPLTWPAGYALPFDLEAVTAVPGDDTTLLALSSNGTVFVLTLSGGTLGLRGTFTLPDRQAGANFEGLRMQRVGAVPLLVWGDRGTGRRPARLAWGRLDFDTYTVDRVRWAALQVPYPSSTDPATRHLTDLDVTTEGDVWIAAASDPGDRGPFYSAVYLAGRLTWQDGQATFAPAPRLRTMTAFDRKIEAVAISPAGIVVGTDDEILGSALTTLSR